MALFTLSDIKFKQDVRKLDSKFENNVLRYPEDLGSADKGHYIMFHINVQDRTSYKFTKDPNKENIPTIFKNRTGLQEQTGYRNIGGNINDVINFIDNEADKIFNKPKTETEPDDVARQLYSGPIVEGIQSGFNTLKSKLSKESLNKIESTGTGILDFTKGLLSGISERTKDITNANFVRKITRTTDSIAFYMPDTLVFDQKQTYSSPSPGGELGQMIGAGTSIVTDYLKNNKQISALEMGKNFSPFVLQLLRQKAPQLFSGTIGEKTTDLILYSAFGTLNPRMELIYTSPEFRSFNFDFKFYPRSEKEARSVIEIIRKLHFHQAPEIDSSTAGFYLTPPSEFDIEFYYNGQQNPNIQKISTCVLDGISCNYAPQGWHAFESVGQNIPIEGSTGMPVGIELRLSFRETEIMTKYNYQNEDQKRDYKRIP